MSNIEDMNQLRLRLVKLAQPTGSKSLLSIPDQVRVDALLYKLGAVIGRLLEENALQDWSADRCHDGDWYDSAPPMASPQNN